MKKILLFSLDSFSSENVKSIRNSMSKDADNYYFWLVNDINDIRTLEPKDADILVDYINAKRNNTITSGTTGESK